MALVTMTLPLCDMCGAISLPSERLPDGTPNPARKHPEQQKRCGTCKSHRWNYKALEAKQHQRAQRKLARA